MRTQETKVNVTRSIGNSGTLQRQKVQFNDNRKQSVSTIQNMANASIQAKPNKTGLPDQLKSGIENLSGYSMDDVKVHYNSSKPVKLYAHAYTQGTDIHVAPGQERHLPHEAWHVVQQKQGRVQPTRQLKGRMNINDDSGLEREADVMGAKAVQFGGLKSDLRKQKVSNSTAQLTAKQGVPTVTNWELNANGGKAGSPEIQNKKNAPDVITGSPTGSSKPAGWAKVLSDASKVKGSWVRFHCINQHVGGKGVDQNLVPTTHQANTGVTWAGFEAELRHAYDLNYWIWAKTEVTYDGSYPDGFPKKIVGYAEYYDVGSTSWIKTPKNGTTLNLLAPDFGVGGVKTRSLDEMTLGLWAHLTGLPTWSAQVQYLNHMGSLYSDVDTFMEKLYAEGAPNFNGVMDKIDAAVKGYSDKVNIAVDY